MNNLALATLSYLVLPLLLLIGVKKSCDLIDQTSSTSVKGLFSVLLIIHHFVLKMWNQQYLEPMAWFGFLIVGWFFLTSGYGTYLSFQKNGPAGFWRKKVKRIWLPFVLSVFLQGLMRIFLLHQEGSVLLVAVHAATFRTLNGSFMWYITTQIVMYCCFFFSFRWIKRDTVRLLMMLLLISGYILVSICLRQQYYNYVTCPSFAIGVILGRNREALRAWLKRIKRFWAAAAAAIILYLVALIITSLNESWMLFILVPAAECAVSVLASLFQFKSAVLHYLGTLSYEIYIAQLTFIDLAIYYFDDTLPSLLFAIATTIVLAVMVSKASGAVLFAIDWIARKRKKNLC